MFALVLALGLLQPEPTVLERLEASVTDVWRWATRPILYVVPVWGPGRTVKYWIRVYGP